MSKLGEY